jgi:hypothetical protein
MLTFESASVAGTAGIVEKLSVGVDASRNTGIISLTCVA